MSPVVVKRRERKVTSLACMQRLFAMFPPAGPGVGLLLLRIAVAVTLVGGAAMPGASWVPMVVAGGLVAGVATPVLAALAAVVHLARLIDHPVVTASEGVAVLSAVALALLGPGAYAIDARLYGRRRVVTSRTTPEGGAPPSNV